MQAYFDQLDRVRYEGPQSTNPLAFRHYNPDELVLGKRMEDHLRFAPVTGIPSAGTARICLV
ncbi:xylose isomerase [Salmonella enterica subsp. enterica]|uniref:Xylose isomerase n=1 Tax=Salmonella enterica I TaxID=59201 RepID=A0A379W296_SALET|nr:xylose isomerase [Salmonella enterica subsp. enterica]